ncbi:MAG: glycosyltransferase family 4 protein [Chloroflexota bacterium]|nr:glycosyltransferase family 4 protein [Chloroflexota bacterium]
MRSLLLAASFPPAMGGVETLLYQTNRRLSDPPLVLAPAPAAAPDIRVQPVRLKFAAHAAYRPLWAVHPSLHYLQLLFAPALRAATTWRPRVIQAGHVYLAPVAWLLARRLGVPFVVYAYGQEVWRAGRPMGLRPLDRLLRGHALRSANAVLVPGRFTVGLLADWQVRPARMVGVPYGAEPRPAIAPPSGTTLLSVARLVPRKGVDTVIRAMPHLAADVEYRVVGGGPEEGRLRTLAQSLGVADRVHFLGRLSDRALADEYRRCTLFVLPARRTREGDLEGYGLVYFEAAAWGRPVVAGRSGGEVDAVVDGQTGVLVDGESTSQVAETLGALLSDPTRLQALGAAGRKRVETTHNWSRAAAVVDATLADLT